MSTLPKKLSAALASRDDRLIRRRLPDPATSSLIDFTSNDYLSLSMSPHLRSLFLHKLHNAPAILGSGGSRLLVNGAAHSALEERLKTFFNAPAALLFNSGFDANVGFFSAIPQPGDAIVYDEHIHASVHDGMRASRVHHRLCVPFLHNSLIDLRRVLGALTLGSNASVFVSVESLYSMDGTFSPLRAISELLEELFPGGNAYLVVDEAHSTGIYGPQGRGRVAQLGLETKVLARLHTFGKALASTGAVVVTTELIRDYLLNYARSLIYTTSLSYANIIAADASLDLLTDGTTHQLSAQLFSLCTHFVNTLVPRLRLHSVPPHLLSLPSSHLPTVDPTPLSPIIPVFTVHSRALSAFLLERGINARSITWPTVPKGKERVRICLHAGNSREEVEMLVGAMVAWADAVRGDVGRVESKL